MNSQEKELEVLVRNIDTRNPLPVLPVFEMYITLFSLTIATMLFAYPEMLMNAPNQPDLYKYMTYIMAQWVWGFAFFLASILKSIGLMFDVKIMRYIGLVISSLLYLALSSCYIMSFPSIGSAVFICMTIFTLISLPIVKHTSLKKKENNKNEEH